MTVDADIVIVGGGIAGCAAAWFAVQAGRDVTLVDDGRNRASDVPIALVNPLRGHDGRLVARGVDGMHATFALVERLLADGHPIATGRGLFRPLVDRGGDALEERWWRERVASSLAFDWHAIAPVGLGLATPVPALHLRDAGWIEPVGFLKALSSDASITRLQGRVAGVDGNVVTFADGSRLTANALLWCAGALGAAGLDGDRPDPADDGRYKPGSLLRTDVPLTSTALSFGLYAVPIAGGTLIGPTREPTVERYTDAPVAPLAVQRVEDRIARLFGRAVSVSPAWRGMRLARLSSAARLRLHGVPTLTELGSRGFLMAPLLAREWAASL